jgi:hypothetical protein
MVMLTRKTTMNFRDRVAIAERLQNADPEAARLLTAAEKVSRDLEAENKRLRAALSAADIAIQALCADDPNGLARKLGAWAEAKSACQALSR